MFKNCGQYLVSTTAITEEPSYLEDPKKGDLINQLNLKPNAQGNRKMFNILRIAQAGDTLENMVYGTEVDDNFLPEKSQFEKALRLIDKYQPDFFLFSGGGNDIAATELVTFLNHAESKLGSRRESQINYVVNEVFQEIFAYLFEQVLTPAQSRWCEGTSMILKKMELFSISWSS